MRPVRLTFAGLRSYRSETVVDFADLDLFAVIGDTGSGKSTIIEALCLALYARKSWTGGESGLADMITDGVNTMRIEFTFVAGDHEWTVMRARHRNSSAPIDRLVSATGGVGADGARPVTARVAEVIGLTYEQFTRAVVLPQGRFDSLLRATEKERNQILTSILDLGDVVATRARAEALRNEWSPRLVEWSTERRQFPVDPAVEIAVAERAVADTTELDRLLDVAVGEVEQAAARAAATSDARRNLRSALDAVLPLPGAPARRLAELADTWTGIDRQRATLHAELDAASQRWAELEGRATALLRGADSRDALVAARSESARVLADLPAAAEAVAAAEAEVRRLDSAQPDRGVPGGVRREATEAEAAATAAEAARRAAEAAVDAARVAWAAVRSAQERVATAESASDELEQRLAKGRTLSEGAVASVVAAEVAAEAARDAERAALRSDAAATAGDGCRPGDDCPVCGRGLDGDYTPPTRSSDTEAARAAVIAAVDELTSRRAEAQRIAEHLGELSARAALRSDERAAAARTLAEAVTGAVAAGADPDATEEAVALAAVVAASTAASAAAEAARGSERVATAALAQAEATAAVAAETHRRDVSAAADALRLAELAVASLDALLAGLPGEWRLPADRSGAPPALEFANSTVAGLTTAIDGLQANDADRVAAGTARHAAERDLDVLGVRLADEVQRPLATFVGDTNAALDSVRRLDSAVEAAAAVAGASAAMGAVPTTDPRNRFEVGVLVAPPDPTALASFAADVEASGERAAAAVAAGQALSSMLDDEAVAAETRISEILASVQCETVGKLSERRGEVRRDLEQAVAALSAARSDADRAAELDRRLVVAAPFVANVTALSTALRDQHFIAHLVDAREQELLAEASRRLKDISGGRFGFVADFGIVDVRSGEVRTPDALSGGERFQAALALALGLVEIASRGKGRLDAVFVDEGFGSLDGSALDDALGTLGKVAGGGKMVALISHLRHVAESVDTVLLVSKDELLGSRIERLDADQREALLADDIRSGLTS